MIPEKWEPVFGKDHAQTKNQTLFAVSVKDPRRRTLAAVTFYACGGALLLFVAAGPWIIRHFGYGVFIPTAAASGLLTIAATALAAEVDERITLAVALALALTMRLLLVGEEPFLSNDLYRYIWDGRVQAAGINPYLYVPADPALAALRDAAVFPHINRADYAVTVYPPVAQAIYLAVTRVAETAWMMRLAMVGFEAVIVIVLLDLARRLALPRAAVVAYAWHPLAIWEIANNGHAEAAMVALLMIGVWLLVRARRVAGAVAVTLAAMVKPYAVLVLPAFWRPWDWRVPLAIAATVLLCYAPYLGAGKAVLGFAGGYIGEEGLASGDGIWLVALAQSLFGRASAFVIAYLAAAAVIMIGLGLLCRFDPDRPPRMTIDATIVLLTVGLILMSPNYAWYFLALVPFLALGAGATAWALTLGAFLLYRPIYLGASNDLIWKSLATLPFVLVLGVMLVRRLWQRDLRRAA
jgi:alpha-1,6-mannosyltransferase